MNTAWRTFVVSLAITLFGVSAQATETAQNTNEIVRESLRADKKALVATNLDLTKKEAEAFWPIYDRYQKELFEVQSRLFEVIAEYASTVDTMTDERAKDLVERYLAVEEDRAKIRRSYLSPISGVLPGLKVARFYQIENKIDAVVRFEAAAEIPLVKAQ